MFGISVRDLYILRIDPTNKLRFELSKIVLRFFHDSCALSNPYTLPMNLPLTFSTFGQMIFQMILSLVPLILITIQSPVI